jgi:hypothetical protein
MMLEHEKVTPMLPVQEAITGKENKGDVSSGRSTGVGSSRTITDLLRIRTCWLLIGLLF